MATLVLSSVGQTLGGPIGAALGAFVGRQVDGVLLGPGVRQGPRLSDLRMQTSSYGSVIPKVFGRARVAGTVIWSTDLIETQSRQSNGKGRGSTDRYSYKASFAVALSVRQIEDIGRIWADGRLIRGAAGDLKVETGFRVYTGAEDQAVDPMIASYEGANETPAYRGLAYVVFEDMQLADFGNRIPSLSFEVIADPQAIAAGDVLSALAPISNDGGPLLDGLVASGDSVRGFAEVLAGALPFSIIDDGELRVRFDPDAPTEIAPNDLGARQGTPAPRFAMDRGAADETPDGIVFSYIDGGRDYQTGTQQAHRDSPGRRLLNLDLVATLSAADARRIAEMRLARLWAERTTAKITVPWRGLMLSPGDHVTVPGVHGEWRIVTAALEGMSIQLSLVQVDKTSAPQGVADAGRPLQQADQVHGPTTLRVLDLPPLMDSPNTEPVMVVAANGASSGWRRATLFASIDGGASYVDIGQTRSRCPMGALVLPLAAPKTCALADRVNVIEVQLINPDDQLSDADFTALLRGDNLALVGEEVIQFGRAEPLGNGIFRLSDLWRGRRGTEWAATLHAVGTDFTLLTQDSLERLADAYSVSGVTVMAVGLGDENGVTASASGRIGQAVMPLSVVRLNAVIASGDTVLTWTRRSRDGWRWLEAVEAPIAEEREAYRIVKRAVGRSDLIVDTASPSWTYSASERALDAAAGALQATIQVAQIGTYGLGPTEQISVPTL